MAKKSKEAKWNEETQSGAYSDKIHWGEMKVKQKEMITHLNEKAIACQVNEDATNISVAYKGRKLSWDIKGDPDDTDWEILPEGRWSILGRPEEMTREQCEKVMEGYDGSLYTLLKSKGLNPETTLILIKE